MADRRPFRVPRRALLAGGLATLVLPRAGRAAAGRASRRFRILRDGEEIGTQITTVARDGAALETTVSVRILVKVLGVPAYRYELDSRARWQGDRLVSLDGATNDDGEAQVAEVRLKGDELVSSGTWTGSIPAHAVPTTYWTPAFLARSPWISTQTGRPLAISAARAGTETIPGPGGEVACARWTVSGELDLTLYFDERGEWMGNAFDAGGKPARFRAETASPALAALWDPA